MAGLNTGSHFIIVSYSKQETREFHSWKICTDLRVHKLRSSSKLSCIGKKNREAYFLKRNRNREGNTQEFF